MAHNCCAPEPSESVARSERSVVGSPKSACHSEGNVGLQLGLIGLLGGDFTMGAPAHDGTAEECERPEHQVRLAPFAVARYAVTNDLFADFVRTTGYQTTAEFFGWSFVFGGLLPHDFPPTQGIATAPWWRRVDGADWRHPEGPHSNIIGHDNHPVVHVSCHDAVAFCNWSATRLPTEAEWEYSARGGRLRQRFPWGNDLEPGGEHRMNVFQGTFPEHNTAADGWVGTCPVDAFEPNDFGLHNVTGNVWEWCSDWFSSEAYRLDRSDNPSGPLEGTQRVIRGGSYLCHRSYCERYRVAARSANTPDSTTGNIGFRVVRSIDPVPVSIALPPLP